MEELVVTMDQMTERPSKYEGLGAAELMVGLELE